MESLIIWLSISPGIKWESGQRGGSVEILIWEREEEEGKERKEEERKEQKSTGNTLNIVNAISTVDANSVNAINANHAFNNKIYFASMFQIK